jgi:3-methyladenine DNA glycosylase AlkD
MDLKSLIHELDKCKNTKKAKLLSRFFKTGKGEYGQGDIFIGINVPTLRNIAKKNQDLSLKDTEKLIKNPIHEYRLTALFILIIKYSKANSNLQKQIYNLYLKNKKYINNWDLIDLSSNRIIGNYILKNPSNKQILYSLSKSDNLWDRRIAVMATFEFIKNFEYGDALKISKILLNDKEDLIQKAVGWMLREIGKRDFQIEENFLHTYYKKMPRTMLRYAIEKFSTNKKAYFMRK